MTPEQYYLWRTRRDAFNVGNYMETFTYKEMGDVVTALLLGAVTLHFEEPSKLGTDAIKQGLEQIFDRVKEQLDAQ